MKDVNHVSKSESHPLWFAFVDFRDLTVAKDSISRGFTRARAVDVSRWFPFGRVPTVGLWTLWRM